MTKRPEGRFLKIWQGRKDSNPRMSESKSDALTNLATPLHGKQSIDYFL